MHEASLYKQNCFITLTYDDDHAPLRNSLHYPTFQKFMKRLRKEASTPVRFYMCGEYGELNNRPHFHSLLFGFDFPDKRPYRLLVEHAKLYTSETLQRLWPYGHSCIGEVTFESAAYVARYCLKKVTGKNAEEHYARSDEYGDYYATPEFARMSLKPGIGAKWLEKYQTDVYPRNYTVVNGVEVKPPKYYDRKIAEVMPHDIDVLKDDRRKEAEEYLHDATPERLAVREQVTKARLALKQRRI